MNRVLPIIAFLIVLSGLGMYIKWNLDDFYAGQQKVETQGTSEYRMVKMVEVASLMQNEKEQDALSLMLQTVGKEPENIEDRLNLAKIYFSFCKKEYTHCEDAYWHLNVILKNDSTNVEAKFLIKKLDVLLSPKKIVNPDRLK